MAYLLIGCRFLIGLVFLVSAASKLHNRRARADFLAATTRFAPSWLLRLVAMGHNVTPTGALRVSVGVLIAEAVVPVLLAVPATARIGFGVATMLLIAFTGALWRVSERGERISCACFATSSAPVGTVHIVRNLMLLVVTVVGVVGQPAGSVHPIGVLLCALAAATVAAIVVFTDDLVELYQ